MGTKEKRLQEVGLDIILVQFEYDKEILVPIEKDMDVKIMLKGNTEFWYVYVCTCVYVVWTIFP